MEAPEKVNFAENYVKSQLKDAISAKPKVPTMSLSDLKARAASQK